MKHSLLINRWRNCFIAIMALLLSTNYSMAQQTILIGDGTSTDNHLPIEPYYHYTYSQSIYTHDEIGDYDGYNITSIQYHFVNTAGSSSSYTDAIQVYMGNTSKTAFESTTDWISTDDLTLVYDGTYTLSSSDEWITINLNTPFEYNNTDNIVIAVDENTAGYHTDYNEFYCHSTTGYSSIYYYSDNTNPDPSNPPTIGSHIGTLSYRPNIKITFEPDKLPQVSTLSISNITDSLATGNMHIDSLGYPHLTACGICWNTTGTPTISDSYDELGALSDTGSYTTSISDLTYNTTYYVRAYATNDVGTAYGDEIIFTALNADFSASVSSIDFGDIPIGNDASQTITVSNTGEVTLDITDIIAPSNCSVSPLTASISSGDNSTFTITCLASTLGEFTDTIVFTSNAGSDTVIAVGTSNYAAASNAGNAMDFDGSDDYISTSSTIDLTADYTVDLWFNAPSLSHDQVLLGLFGSTTGGDPGVYLVVKANGTIRYLNRPTTGNSGGTNIYTSNTFNDNTWHHLAAVKNGTSMYIYIDGVLENSGTTSDITSELYPFFGKNGLNDASVVFNGQIDETRIWSKALTQEEIRSQYGPLAGNEDGLYAYWRFDEDDGDYVYDATGNGNTGTLMNGTAREIPSTAPVGDPVLATMPDPVSFGSISSGESVSIDYEIINAGGGILHLDSMYIDDTYFTATPQSDNIFSGDSSTISASFTSTEYGDLSSYFKYYHNMGTDSLLVEAYCVSLPTLNIVSTDNITGTSADVSFQVTDLGAPTPSQYGVCWNTTGTPAIEDAYSNEGAMTETGTYNSTASVLKPITPYYARAYVVNGTIVTYSDELSFTTTKITPVITWATPSGITYGTALDGTQLNAVADVAGTFTYSPASGTMLDAGDSQELKAVFTPTYTDSVFVDTAMVNINVAKAALTATAGDASRTYGEDNPAFTVSYTGFVNDEDATVLDTEPTATSEAIATSDAGSYEIVASGGEDGNYEFTYQVGTLTVNKAALAVGVEDETIEKGTTIPDFILTYNGFVNSEDESVLDETPTATCSATTESDAGTYDIVVSGGSDNNYEMSYTNGTLTITPLSGLGDASVATISVYPNPVSDKVNINLNETMGTISYKLLSITGKVMKADVVENGSVSIDMSRFETGIYILKLLQDNKELNYRIVKE